jgi:hypothetical protein
MVIIGVLKTKLTKDDEKKKEAKVCSRLNL